MLTFGVYWGCVDSWGVIDRKDVTETVVLMLDVSEMKSFFLQLDRHHIYNAF